MTYINVLILKCGTKNIDTLCGALKDYMDL